MGDAEPENISDVKKSPRSKSHKKLSSKDKSLPESSAFAALDLFRDYFEDRLRSLKCELKDNAYQISEMFAKKLKTEKSYQFKFSGNQKQFEFNGDLDDDIGRIKRVAEAKDYAKIKDICSDVRDKIHKCNKCIKLADKSPGGWDTVKEYMSDDLASDTDDEKRIRQAETRAIRKRNQRKQENSQRRQSNARPAPSATFPNPSSDTVTNTGSNFRSFNRISTGPLPTDICFGCNEQGHWRRNCPKIIIKQTAI
jgi:hypothetical protein